MIYALHIMQTKEERKNEFYVSTLIIRSKIIDWFKFVTNLQFDTFTYILLVLHLVVYYANIIQNDV